MAAAVSQAAASHPIPSDTNQPLEADYSSGNDTDSVGSDLTSIASSVFQYQYENGRRYHAYRDGKYILPIDEQEQERLDLLHHVFRLIVGGDLCYTKLDNPTNVLDIGTGTGIWAVQLADEFPAARVLGVDVSPIQPSWVPSNLSFQVDDAEEPWVFPMDSFDFIHIRCLAGSIRDWPALLRQCYRHLRSGGKIELSECRTQIFCDDGTYTTDTSTYQWVAEFHRIAENVGIDFDAFPKYSGWLKEAGFTQVKEEERKCPIGGWAKDKKLKEIGKVFKYQFINSAVDSYSLAMFTRMGGWSSDDTTALLTRVRSEFMSGKMHTYAHCSYAIGQKP